VNLKTMAQASQTLSTAKAKGLFEAIADGYRIGLEI